VEVPAELVPPSLLAKRLGDWPTWRLNAVLNVLADP